MIRSLVLVALLGLASTAAAPAPLAVSATGSSQLSWGKIVSNLVQEFKDSKSGSGSDGSKPICQWVESWKEKWGHGSGCKSSYHSDCGAQPKCIARVFDYVDTSICDGSCNIFLSSSDAFGTHHSTCCNDPKKAAYGTCKAAKCDGRAKCDGLSITACSGDNCPQAGAPGASGTTLTCQVLNNACLSQQGSKCFGTVSCPTGKCPSGQYATIAAGMTCIADATGCDTNKVVVQGGKGYLTGPVKICTACSATPPPPPPPAACTLQPGCAFTTAAPRLNDLQISITEATDTNDGRFLETLIPPFNPNTFTYIAYRDIGFDSHPNATGVVYTQLGSVTPGASVSVQINSGTLLIAAPSTTVSAPLLSGTNVVDVTVRQAACAGCGTQDYTVALYSEYKPPAPQCVLPAGQPSAELNGFTLNVGGQLVTLTQPFNGVSTWQLVGYIGTAHAVGDLISFVPAGYTAGARFRISFNFAPYTYDVPVGTAITAPLIAGRNFIQIDVLQDPACGRDIAEYTITLYQDNAPAPSRRLLAAKVATPVAAQAATAAVVSVAATGDCPYTRSDVTLEALSAGFVPTGGSVVAVQLNTAFSALNFHYTATVATLGAGVLQVQLGHASAGATLAWRVSRHDDWAPVDASTSISVPLAGTSTKPVLLEVLVAAAACTGDRFHVYTLLLANQ